MIEIENRDWRSPTDSEVEIIRAWRRKVLRERKRMLIASSVMLIVPILLFLLSYAAFYLTTFVRSLSLISFLLFIFIVFFESDVYRRWQIRRGYYQIMDVVVMNKRHSFPRKFVIQAKTASGDLLDIAVEEFVFDATRPKMPGFLMLYGKNTSSQKAKPNEFMPLSKADMNDGRVVQDDRSAEKLLHVNWRLPNASESERIAAWTKKIIRADLPTVIAGILLPCLIPVVLLILTLFRISIPKGILIIGFTFFLASLFQLITFLSSLRQQRNLLTGNYQFADVVVVSKISPSDSRDSGCFIKVKIPSGEMIDVDVHKIIYAAATKGASGFLVCFTGDNPEKNGMITYFFPTKSIEE